MPRIRTIKPEHWEDIELPKISLGAHLMWIGMWNFSDDQGVIEADALLIKNRIFPRRKDIGIGRINQWLDQLREVRYIVPFTYAKQSYYLHRTFDTHQRIDKPQPSKIPDQFIKKILTGLRSENVPGDILPVLDSTVKESSVVDAHAPPIFKKNNEEKKKDRKTGSPEVGKKDCRPAEFSVVLEHFDRMLSDRWNKRDISLEAQKFFNHYEGNGWKVNGHAIENWYAKANEWIIREVEKR